MTWRTLVLRPDLSLAAPQPGNSALLPVWRWMRLSQAWRSSLRTTEPWSCSYGVCAIVFPGTLRYSPCRRAPRVGAWYSQIVLPQRAAGLPMRGSCPLFLQALEECWAAVLRCRRSGTSAGRNQANRRHSGALCHPAGNGQQARLRWPWRRAMASKRGQPGRPLAADSQEHACRVRRNASCQLARHLPPPPPPSELPAKGRGMPAAPRQQLPGPGGWFGQAECEFAQGRMTAQLCWLSKLWGRSSSDTRKMVGCYCRTSQVA